MNFDTLHSTSSEGSRHDILLPVITDICRDLSLLTPGLALNRLADSVCRLLDVQTCIIWENDLTTNQLRVTGASADLNDSHRRLTLDANDVRVRNRLVDRNCTHIADINDDPTYVDVLNLQERGCVSLLTVPVYTGERLTGLVDAYSKRQRHFEPWEMKALQLIAQETDIAYHGVERKVEELNRIVQELTEAQSEDQLFRTTLRRALDLVGCERGWISKLDAITGNLVIVAEEGSPDKRPSLRLGQGITGKALYTGQAVRVEDVMASPDYEEFWSDTRSELAIPILVENVEIRIGANTSHGSKRIAVLNVESPQFGAFFSLDVDRLQMLVRQTALVYERIETDNKFAALNRIETRFAQGFKIDVDEILRTIAQTLGFEVLNISLVEPLPRRVRSKHVVGLPVEAQVKFKELADFSLDDDPSRIEVQIIKSKQPEVVVPADPRIQPDMFKRFNHADIIRVVVPMISHVNNEVIGTIEAGYRQSIRPYIYERDVRLLKDFSDFATPALAQHRDGLLEKILHDLRAPATSLKGDAEYIQNKYRHLREDRTYLKLFNKLTDMTLDAELLLIQVTQLERLFGGGPKYIPTPERTIVYRDIVIKCLNQLRGMIYSHGFDTRKVKYDPGDAGKMVLWLDQALLNNVVLNLLTNAVKYAEDDPAKFAIHVELSEDNNEFVLKFKDWGIGIKPEFTSRIFEEGFRTPQAKAKSVTGSGFGLNIARENMRDIGGDLRLTHFAKPTEFQVILPKRLKEVRDDFDRR